MIKVDLKKHPKKFKRIRPMYMWHCDWCGKEVSTFWNTPPRCCYSLQMVYDGFGYRENLKRDGETE